ncbi:tripartite tricarboxylate transporter substrate-binding protein [Bengtsoniella intestinalis]|uniref:tripartite tricarboxylate transporter substrate-binding protein n=1 Tax=Bengtsoniella intestinalis TaxID=3073143 RepID=UPI00391EEF5F
MRRLYAVIVLFALALTLTGCQSETVEYPNRDVTVIIPFNAGGGIDISGRALFTEIDTYYEDISFVPTNITGASGTIGATELYYADNDGYTLMVAGNGMNVAHISNNFELTFNDFQLVAQYVVSTPGLFVRSDSPYQTYEEFIAAAGAEEGAIKMGVSTGTVNHYAVMGIEDYEDVSFQSIIIGGDQAQQPELLSGRVDAYVTAVSLNTAYLDSGDFRCLAVFSDERLESMPDVPTFAELGLEDDYQLSFGVWAPAGTPDDVVATVAAAVERACTDPDFVESMAVLGYTVEYQDTESYIAIMDASLTNIIDLADKMGLSDITSLDPYNGPYTIPKVLAIAIAVMAVLEILRKKYMKEAFKPQLVSLFKGNVPIFVLSLFAFAFVFELIGYTFATTIYLTVMVLYLRRKVYPELPTKLVLKTAGLSLVFSVVSYLFFTQVAGILMPVSPLGIL